MRYLFINASPRWNGSTASLLNTIKDGLPKESNIDWVDIYKLSIQPCTGCLKCRPNKECILPEDDAHRLSIKLKNSDVIIIGSPTYWGNITGPLKTFFDRSVTTFREIASINLEAKQTGGTRKKAVIVATSNSKWPQNLKPTQGKGTIRAIKTILQYGGYQIVGTINYGNAGSEKGLSKKVKQKVLKLGKSL